METKSKMWKKLIFPIICFIVVIVVVFSMNDIDEVFATIRTVDGINLTYALLLLLLYFALWPVSLMIFTKARGLNIKMRDVFLIGSTEHFFNGITPFSTGGQPFEAYAYKKRGINYSDSTGILLINFIAFQIVICIAGVVAFILNFNFLRENVPSIMTFMIIGLVINLIILSLFICLGCVKFIRDLFLKLFKALSKIKFLNKFIEPKIPTFEHYCNDYQMAFKEIVKHKLAFLLSLIIKAITMFVYYSIPFFILRATGVNLGFDQLMFVSAMTCFSITMTCWIPTPGASGGIEFAFKTLFAAISGVTSVVAVSGMLLWRFITYYFIMFISFIAFIMFNSLSKKA